MRKNSFVILIALCSLVLGCGSSLSDSDYDAKIKRAKESLQDDYDNPKTHLYLGVLYGKKGLFQEAERAYQTAITLDERFIDAYINLGNLYFRQKDYNQAVLSLKKASDLDSTDPKIYYLLASIYKEMKSFDQAILSYFKVIKLNPKHILAYNYMGVTYYESKHYNKARESFLKAIELNPNFADAYGNLGILFQFNFHDLKGAVMNYEKFLSLKHEGENVALIQDLMESAKIELGEIKEQKKKLKDKKNEEDKIQSLLKEAKILYQDKSYKEAKDKVDNYLSFIPEAFEATKLLAQIEIALNHDKNAIKIIRKMLKLNPSDFELWFWLTQLYQKTHQKKELKKAQENFLRYAPESDSRRKTFEPKIKFPKETPPPKKIEKKKPIKTSTPKQSPRELAKKYFYQGVQFQKERKYQEAIKAYQKSVQNDPRHVSAHYNLGIVYKWTGNYQNAIKFYLKTISLDPRHARAYYNLGLLYRKLGRHEDAIQGFEKSIEINPNYADSYLGLGLMYSEIYKDKKNAVYYFKKYIKLNPNGATPEKIKSWLKSVGE